MSISNIYGRDFLSPSQAFDSWSILLMQCPVTLSELLMLPVLLNLLIFSSLAQSSSSLCPFKNQENLILFHVVGSWLKLVNVDPPFMLWAPG
jgi:hypothetical protein